MGVGTNRFQEGMRQVEDDIKARYENVESASIGDIDVSAYQRTNAAGVVRFSDGKPAMGFDVEIAATEFSSLSHEGRVPNRVVLWELRR